MHTITMYNIHFICIMYTINNIAMLFIVYTVQCTQYKYTMHNVYCINYTSYWQSKRIDFNFNPKT